MRLVDTLIVFRILKMLTTKFEKMPAYKFGFIDKNGKRLKQKPDPDNPGKMIPNEPKTKEEKSSLTPLHRLVFNLKKIIGMVPFGKTAFASYAVALLLLKEETGLDSDQMEELCEKFYRHLKDEDLLKPEQITECLEHNELTLGVYRLRHNLRQGDEHFKPKSVVEILGEHSRVFGVTVYVGLSEDRRVLITAEDVY